MVARRRAGRRLSELDYLVLAAGIDGNPGMAMEGKGLAVLE